MNWRIPCGRLVLGMDVKIAPSWKTKLENEFSQPYFNQLIEFVKQEYKTQTVYPPGKEIFKAFDACGFNDVKVVIIGQDPYHGAGQANGLCFSVREDVRMPPSLVNIFKEIQNDLRKPIPKSGDLTRWAEQGVLLLNATLTVRASSPGSHQWGSYAQKKGEIIDRKKHYVLMSAHPSPFSADKGFFGNKHFSKTNEYLRSKGIKEINW